METLFQANVSCRRHSFEMDDHLPQHHEHFKLEQEKGQEVEIPSLGGLDTTRPMEANLFEEGGFLDFEEPTCVQQAEDRDPNDLLSSSSSSFPSPQEEAKWKPQAFVSSDPNARRRTSARKKRRASRFTLSKCTNDEGPAERGLDLSKKAPTKGKRKIVDEEGRVIYAAWGEEEDSQLLAIMERVKQRHEFRNCQDPTADGKFWTIVGREMLTRSGKQCRDRWRNSLDPSISKAKWTIQEDVRLIQMHSKIGNKWAKIARELPGRTENGVKTRHKAISRALKRHWSPEEDSKLLSLYHQLGPKWGKIKERMSSTRAIHNVKTRCQAILSGNAKTDEVANGSPDQALKYIRRVLAGEHVDLSDTMGKSKIEKGSRKHFHAENVREIPKPPLFRQSSCDFKKSSLTTPKRSAQAMLSRSGFSLEPAQAKRARLGPCIFPGFAVLPNAVVGVTSPKLSHEQAVVAAASFSLTSPGNRGFGKDDLPSVQLAPLDLEREEYSEAVLKSDEKEQSASVGAMSEVVVCGEGSDDTTPDHKTFVSAISEILKH